MSDCRPEPPPAVTVIVPVRNGERTIEACLASMRTAAENAAFFLPYLRPGLRLLDVGSGPGSITLGLAEAVAPGEAVGIEPTLARFFQFRLRA